MKTGRINYGKRNKLLALAVALSFLVIYFAAIDKTLALYSDNARMINTIERAENAPVAIARLEQKLTGLNSRLLTFVADSVGDRENILQVVSHFCSNNSITFRDYPQVALTKEKDYTVQTNVVVAEGNFSNLLKLLFELEKEKQIARPASVSYRMEYDHKRKKQVLSMTIYLQNISVNNEK